MNGSARPISNRRLLRLASIGVALILFAFLIVFLVVYAKKQFYWLVGSGFLGSVVGLVVAGAILFLVAVWLLPYRRTPLGWVLLAWGVVALISPLFGMMFLGPWVVLLVTAPGVIWVLWSWSRLG